MFKSSINPVYVYTAIVDLIALLVGFGVVMWTDAQEDLVAKVIASIILAATGVSVPAAKEVQNRVESAKMQGMILGSSITPPQAPISGASLAGRKTP